MPNVGGETPGAYATREVGKCQFCGSALTQRDKDKVEYVIRNLDCDRLDAVLADFGLLEVDVFQKVPPEELAECCPACLGKALRGMLAQWDEEQGAWTSPRERRGALA